MGTLSVRAPDKQHHFEATQALERLAEPIAALTGIDADGALRQAWTLMLQNAAHDTACGSGIDAVAEASRRRSDSARQLAEGIADRDLPQLAGTGQVWNPSAFPRRGLVEVDGTSVLTPTIRGGSVVSLTPTHPTRPATAEGARLENAHLACELLPDGTLSVVDRRTDVRYEGLHRLVDDGDAGFRGLLGEPQVELGAQHAERALLAGPRARLRRVRVERRRRLSQAALAVTNQKVRRAYSPVVIAGAVRVADFFLLSFVGVALYLGYVVRLAGFHWEYIAAIFGMIWDGQIGLMIVDHGPDLAF